MQPVSVGGMEGASKTAAFFAWADKRLPKDEAMKIKALHRTYWSAAIRAGLTDAEPKPSGGPKTSRALRAKEFFR